MCVSSNTQLKNYFKGIYLLIHQVFIKYLLHTYDTTEILLEPLDRTQPDGRVIYAVKKKTTGPTWSH